MGGRSSAVADAIRADIVSGLHAPGTPMREMSLVEQFSVSRRTIREALLELAAEGIVVHRHNQGAAVRQFEYDDIVDLYRVRRVLESEGARACTQAPDALISAVETAFERVAEAARGGLSSGELAWADAEFHGAIISLAASPRIDDFYKRIGSQMAFAIMLLQQDDAEQDRNVERIVAEHKAIFHAVAHRDAFEAQRLILGHIDHYERALLERAAKRS